VRCDARCRRRVARTYGLDVHGTIRLLSGACRDGKLSEPAAGNLLDALRVRGLRLPAQAPSFPVMRASTDCCRHIAGIEPAPYDIRT
jgi:hypothetical protein